MGFLPFFPHTPGRRRRKRRRRNWSDVVDCISCCNTVYRYTYAPRCTCTIFGYVRPPYVSPCFPSSPAPIGRMCVCLCLKIEERRGHVLR